MCLHIDWVYPQSDRAELPYECRFRSLRPCWSGTGPITAATLIQAERVSGSSRMRPVHDTPERPHRFIQGPHSMARLRSAKVNPHKATVLQHFCHSLVAFLSPAGLRFASRRTSLWGRSCRGMGRSSRHYKPCLQAPSQAAVSDLLKQHRWLPCHVLAIRECLYLTAKGLIYAIAAFTMQWSSRL